MADIGATPGSSRRISTDTVKRAVNALLKWKSSKSMTEKPQLLEQDEFVYLVLTLKKIPPKSRTNAHKIPVPHSLHAAEAASELCLIISDKLPSDAAKQKIKVEDIPISKVLKYSKLKSDYKPFEAKRKLCDSYDMFFADKRVVTMLPKVLGKQFFKKKKIPVPLDLTQKNWKEQIGRACSSALFFVSTGTCSVLRVGKASMESEEIVENVVAAINGVVEVVPKKWNGVRSFHLKFSDSLALPVYQVVPDLKLKIEGTKKLGEKVEEVKKVDEKEKVGDEKLGKSKKKKGRIHEVKYMDEEDKDKLCEEEEGVGVEGEKSESGNADVGGLELGGKKRKKGKDLKLKVEGAKKLGEKVKEVKKIDEKEKVEDEKLGKSKKKKGRIHEVKYMDEEDKLEEEEEVGVEGEKTESGNADVGGLELGAKKRKKENSTKLKEVAGGEKRLKELFAGKFDGEKSLKKLTATLEKREVGGEEKTKKKGGIGKSKDGVSKAKSKKSKKNQLD